MSEIIEHSAVVREDRGDKFLVQVLVDSACKSCKVKSTCAVAKMQNKLIEVPKADLKAAEGEKIRVYYEESTGLKAVLIGYIIPFIVLITGLAAALQFTANEGLAGLIALGFMVLYYLSLFLFKKYLTKTFTFKVKNK